MTSVERCIETVSLHCCKRIIYALYFRGVIDTGKCLHCLGIRRRLRQLRRAAATLHRDPSTNFTQSCHSFTKMHLHQKLALQQLHRSHDPGHSSRHLAHPAVLHAVRVPIQLLDQGCLDLVCQQFKQLEHNVVIVTVCDLAGPI